MTRHLLKLIWNRKRSNLLVMTEILLSFLVLFGVVTLGIFYSDNYRQPLGFSYEDVWGVEIGHPGEWKAESDEALRQLLAALRDLPPVLAAAEAFTGPFDNAGWTSGYTLAGRQHDYSVNVVGDGFREVMGLEVLRGRWFDRQDEGVSFRPVVINARMARDVFGAADPLGQAIPQDSDPQSEPKPEMRVVGVVGDFRQHGEFASPESYVFHRKVEGTALPAPRLVLVKVRPGTEAAFEETLMRQAQTTARDWSFRIRPMSERRAANHRLYLAPLVVIGLVAGFLLLMVALGLTGVLWQSVTQRTREVGLRRAKGASIPAIHRQLLGEILVMTTLSLGVGVLLAVQLPLFDQATGIGAGVYATSLAFSVMCIYCLALACGYYPSRLATRVPPAEALRYE
jgi:putative ABC transport system permease protein